MKFVQIKDLHVFLTKLTKKRFVWILKDPNNINAIYLTPAGLQTDSPP